MMKKGCVFLMIGLQVILSAFKADNGNMEMEQIENKFCDISEFTDSDYYSLCYSPDRKIAYVEQDSEPNYQCRRFQWIEKESFNMRMNCSADQEQTTEIQEELIQCFKNAWQRIIIAASVLTENDEKEEPKKNANSDVVMEDYCGMDEFEDLNYYLFCDSQLHEGAGGFTFKPCIIGGETETIEEAKQLYHEFIEKLPLDPVKEEEENNAFYVSPDCKWVIMNKWSKHKKISTQMLFYEKEKIREKVTEARNGIYPIMIVKDGDNYREISEKCYEKLIEKQKIFFYDGGYDCFRGINLEGNLFAEFQYDNNLLTIREIENWTKQWSFSLQGIQEEVARIRDDIEEGDTIWVSIQQFEGNEKEGWVMVQADQSSFFRIAYPSGEVTYLGEYMYSACFMFMIH